MVRLEGVADADGPPDSSDSDQEVAAPYLRAQVEVRVSFEDRTWRGSWQVAVERRGTAEVAAERSLTPNGLRQARSRVLRRLKPEPGERIA